jgi:glycosyltransferase involved in cell wall biosynthesis
MNIAYIANIRFPTEKAHGAAIAKACEALTKVGENVTLVVPARRTHISEPALAYYGIKQSFVVRMLGTVDTVGFGKLGFWIQSGAFALSAAHFLRTNPHDVVYGRDELVLSILCMLGVQNIVWESHDGTWNAASRAMAKKALGIVVVSNGLKEFYSAQGIQPKKIYAVPNGIDLAEFAHPESKEDARVRLGLRLDKKIALYIGRLDGWKGTDTLLQASELLPNDITVACVGGEPQQIKTLQKRYPRAIFLGYRPYSELPNNQAAADVLVVPNTAKNDISVRFTSPLKLIAHLASHRPIVASDLPSIRELVGEDMAILVAPDSSEALARGIEKALQHPELADRAYVRAAALDWQMRAKGIVGFLRSRIAPTRDILS